VPVELRRLGLALRLQIRAEVDELRHPVMT
jgi:hypothetical protein